MQGISLGPFDLPRGQQGFGSSLGAGHDGALVGLAVPDRVGMDDLSGVIIRLDHVSDEFD